MLQKTNLTLGESIASQIQQPKMKNFIDTFFSELSPEATQAWPLDLSCAGYQTTYKKIDFGFEQAGMIGLCSIVSEIKNDSSSFMVKTEFSTDDEQFHINLANVYQQFGSRNHNFSHLLVKNFQNFINKQDNTRADNIPPSEILVNASSRDSSKRVNYTGGYVWANQGFDFANMEELKLSRIYFQKYAAERGVIISNSEMRNFTKPCHFSAFNSGEKVEDKFGTKSILGKAFMLEHSWNGRLPSALKKKPLEQQYAEIYNDNKLSRTMRRQKSLELFSKKYLNLMKKFQESKKHKLKVYAKALKMKVDNFLR